MIGFWILGFELIILETRYIVSLLLPTALLPTKTVRHV